MPADIVCFDLEGPLSPQDNAYEVMGLIPNGQQIFEVISRYDDLLALEERPGYEPGTTLVLIAPFLVLHGLSEEDIERLSDQAPLIDGARDLILDLQEESWLVHIISTSYQQHALQTAQRLGVEPGNVACTLFPLMQYRKQLADEDVTLLVQTERDILRLYPPQDDEEIKRRLDRFFWIDLLQTKLGGLLVEIEVMGGKRKVRAARDFARRSDRTLADMVAIGDSITDAAMLQAVHEAGGLAVAFNANQYALPYAAVGLASPDLRELRPVLTAWREGGREGVKSALAGKANPAWLDDREDLDDLLALHMRMRRLVRSQAAELG
jgi:energy-converting hydrogenase A subunit R